jgi:hypothetical protein
MDRVRKLRTAAKAKDYRLHYDNVGEVYALHGPAHHYGLSLSEAEALIERT